MPSLTLLFLAIIVGFTSHCEAVPKTLPHGAASGDTTSHSTVLWARSTVPGLLTFKVKSYEPYRVIRKTVRVRNPDVPVKVYFNRLRPATRYVYQVTNAARHRVTGQFKTASRPNTLAGRSVKHLRFGVSADMMGDYRPFVGVRNIINRDLDFFLFLGDTVYADDNSTLVPRPASSVADLRLKHQEMYTSRHCANVIAQLRMSTSTFVMIDDHEIIDNWAGGAHPSTDPRFDQTGNFISETNFYKNMAQVVSEYYPIHDRTYKSADPRFDGKPDFYRCQTYGNLAGLIIVDGRSFRDQALQNANPTDPSDFVRFQFQSFDLDPSTGQPVEPQRTYLGSEQLKRLKADLMSLQNDGVTWKFIGIPNPMQYFGVLSTADRYEGYERERTEILKFIDDNNIKNVVFITADLHGLFTNNLSYKEGPLSQRVDIDSFEILTGLMGQVSHAGQAIIELGANIPGFFDPVFDQLGISTLEEFNALDMAIKTAAIRPLFDGSLVQQGFDPQGLEGSRIDVELLEGSYTEWFYFGWSEFEIDSDERLTVTTYGVNVYDANPDKSVLDVHPRVVSKFRVTPK